MQDFLIPRGVTAIIGGGGKTSLQNLLAARLCACGSVIITTSTHIWPPECPILYEPSSDEIRAALKRQSLIAVGRACEDGKLGGIDALWDELPRLADYVLVEADGSKGRPLKAPAAHEPVLPAAQLVIAVAGMDGIGQPIATAAHRPELYAALVGKSTDSPVTPEDAARVLESQSGQRKDVSCRYAVVLNKADTQERLRYAQEIAALLPYETYITALTNTDDPIIEHREARL